MTDFGFFGGAIFSIARLNASSVSDAPIWRTASMNRSNCGFSCAAGGLRVGIGFAHLPTSRSICKPLSDDTLERPVRALNIINTEADAVVIPKVKFGDVAVEMSLTAMLIDALHPPLEHA